MGEPVFAFGLVFHLITHTYVYIVAKNLFCSRESPRLWPWAGPYGAISFGCKSTRVIQSGLESLVYVHEWLSGAEDIVIIWSRTKDKRNCMR